MESAMVIKKTERLITTKDLCRLFKRTVMTIYTWRKDRDLPIVRISGDKRDAIRFSLDDVILWATARHITVDTEVYEDLMSREEWYNGTFKGDS